MRFEYKHIFPYHCCTAEDVTSTSSYISSRNRGGYCRKVLGRDHRSKFFRGVVAAAIFPSRKRGGHRREVLGCDHRSIFSRGVVAAATAIRKGCRFRKPHQVPAKERVRTFWSVVSGVHPANISTGLLYCRNDVEACIFILEPQHKTRRTKTYGGTSPEYDAYNVVVFTFLRFVFIHLPNRVCSDATPRDYAKLRSVGVEVCG